MCKFLQSRLGPGLATAETITSWENNSEYKRSLIIAKQTLIPCQFSINWHFYPWKVACQMRFFYLCVNIALICWQITPWSHCLVIDQYYSIVMTSISPNAKCSAKWLVTMCHKSQMVEPPFEKILLVLQNHEFFIVNKWIFTIGFIKVERNKVKLLVIEGSTCEDHWKLVIPGRWEHPLWFTTTPVMISGWKTNKAVWKCFPNWECEIHLAG